MTEPSTPKGRETRDRIVRTAADLMHVHGVKATSVDAVLELAGVGKGQFYHFFTGREELEEAVLELHLARQPEMRHPQSIPHTWEDVDAWFDTVYRLHKQHDFRGGCPLGSLAAEVADRHEGLRARLDEAFKVKARHLAEGLEALRQRGLLRPDADPDALAEFAVAAAQGGLVLARTRRSGSPLRNALNQASAHLRSFSVPRTSTVPRPGDAH